MPLIRVLAEMEITGVRVDTEALRQSSILLTEKVLQLEQEIYQLAGTEFNVSSARQVGEVLFERLKIDEKAKKQKPDNILRPKKFWKNFVPNILL